MQWHQKGLKINGVNISSSIASNFICVALQCPTVVLLQQLFYIIIYSKLARKGIGSLGLIIFIKMSSNYSDSVVRDPTRQPKSTSLVETETSLVQVETEVECQPFYVDLTKLSRHSLEHLRDTGLLPRKTNTDNECDENVDNRPDENDLEICLIREKHYKYISRVFLPTEQPLGYPLVSLDASRPWMIYWTLHGSDLMLVSPTSSSKSASISMLCEKVGDDALSAIVDTLQACWQSMETTLPQHVHMTSEDKELLEESTSRPVAGNSEEKSKEEKTFVAGGFGGGPGQMAHCAVGYASILTLCIVATSNGPSSSKLAWKLLEKIRKPMYAWLLSLQEPNGGFRMHHDGEVDVRGKTMLSVAC